MTRRRTFLSAVLGAITAGIGGPWRVRGTNLNTAPGPIGLLVPFATFPAPIESMVTTTNPDGEERLLVVSGGIAYYVDKHGVVRKV